MLETSGKKKKTKGLRNPQIAIETFRLLASRLEFSSLFVFSQIPLETQKKRREEEFLNTFSAEVNVDFPTGK